MCGKCSKAQDATCGCAEVDNNVTRPFSGRPNYPGPQQAILRIKIFELCWKLVKSSPRTPCNLAKSRLLRQIQEGVSSLVVSEAVLQSTRSPEISLLPPVAMGVDAKFDCMAPEFDDSRFSPSSLGIVLRSGLSSSSPASIDS